MKVCHFDVISSEAINLLYSDLLCSMYPQEEYPQVKAVQTSGVACLAGPNHCLDWGECQQSKNTANFARPTWMFTCFYGDGGGWEGCLLVWMAVEWVMMTLLQVISNIRAAEQWQNRADNDDSNNNDNNSIFIKWSSVGVLRHKAQNP